MGVAETITKFSDGTSTKNLDYGTPGKITFSVVIPNDAHVNSAAMDVDGEELVPGDGFPSNVLLDVGDDGVAEWGFGGSGQGHLGHQLSMKDDSVSRTATFTGSNGGSDTAMDLMLPKYATVQDAYLHVTGNGTTYYPLEGPVMRGASSGANFGFVVKSVGDVNDDGWSDIIVASISADRADLFFGGPTFDNTPDLIMQGSFGSLFGQAITGLGDVNDDTIDDFAIAENNTVRIFFGGPSLDSTADLNLTGEALGNHYFGYTITGGSDLDDDGYPDIVVGDPQNDLDWRGKVYIFNGGPSLDNAFDYRLEGSIGMRFGHLVETGGDLNDDGIDDLVVATPCCFWWLLPGDLRIYKGGPGFGPASLISNPNSNREQEYFGYSVAMDKDHNGDGIDDLLIGAPGNGTGRVYAFWGRQTWLATPAPDRTYFGENDGDQYGYSVSYVGDADNDGRSEIIVGAPTYDEPGKIDIGRSYFINGSTAPTGAIEYPGYQALANGGSWVEGIGDINGDGSLDFTISSLNNDSSRGTVDFFYASYGLEGPVVGIGGAEIVPVTDRPIFNGSKGTFIPISLLQAAIDSTAITYTDTYGNPFVELVVQIGATGPGKITISDISINYTSDTSSIMHLEDAINDLIDAERASGTPGDDAVVTISMESGTKGQIVLGDLLIDHTSNIIPEAIIDSATPTTIEAGDNVTFEGHGVDDGAIVAYNWSSDIEGFLGDTASLDLTLNVVGVHTVSFKVQDDKGRWSLPNTTTVTVLELNLPPVVTIDQPLDGTEVFGELTVTGTAIDPNVADILTVEINIDGLGWVAVNGASPWSHHWNAANETDGVHTIQARAGDGRLFSQIVSIDVTVIHPMPAILVTAPSDIEAYPGARTELMFNLNNTGTGQGIFSLVPSVTPPMQVQLTNKQVILSPGENVDIKIVVILDKTVEAGTIVFVELGVIEIADSSIKGTASVKISIVPDPSKQSVVLEVPADEDGRPGEVVNYEMTIRNTGTVTDSYEITVISEKGWKFTVAVDGAPYVNSISIDEGDIVKLEIAVTIPKNAKRGTVDKITVTVRSLGFSEVVISEAVRTTVLPPKKTSTYVNSIPWIPLTASVLVFAVMAGVLGGTEGGKYGLFWLLIPLYSRLKKEMVLDNFKRGEINAFIKLNPGTYYNEIKKHLGVSNGVLTYHLNKLEMEGYIKSKVSGRYKHYFPADMKLPKKIVILNELQRGLLKFIREYSAVTQAQVSEHFDLPLPTVSRHLRRLLDSDMISVERHGNLNYYSLQSFGSDMAGEYYTYQEEYYTPTPPGA